MKTIFDREINLPKMKNCRVDYKELNGKVYSVLVDFINNNYLFFTVGSKSIKDVYCDFKFLAINEMQIDNFSSYLGIELSKIDNLKYYI